MNRLILIYLCCLARHVDKMLNSDSILTTLCDKLSAGGGNMAGSGLSGLQDRDYPLASQTGINFTLFKE